MSSPPPQPPAQVYKALYMKNPNIPIRLPNDLLAISSRYGNTASENRRSRQLWEGRANNSTDAYLDNGSQLVIRSVVSSGLSLGLRAFTKRHFHTHTHSPVITSLSYTESPGNHTKWHVCKHCICLKCTK